MQETFSTKPHAATACGFLLLSYTITLRESEGGGTEAVWRQVITGLNAKGNALIQRLEETASPTRMAEVEKMFGYYLKTGRALKAEPRR